MLVIFSIVASVVVETLMWMEEAERLQAWRNYEAAMRTIAPDSDLTTAAPTTATKHQEENGTPKPRCKSICVKDIPAEGGIFLSTKKMTSHSI